MRKSLRRFNFLLSTDFKAITTILLSAFACVMAITRGGRAQELVFVGMLFSTLGDLTLMDYGYYASLLFKKYSFYAGMVMFGITHVIYAYAFAVSGGMLALEGAFGAWPAVVMGMGICFVLTLMRIDFSEKNMSLKAGVVLYSLAISADVTFITAKTALVGGRCILALIGIVIFIISDAMVLYKRTRTDRIHSQEKDHLDKLIWVTYPIAQLLIIIGI